MVAKASEAHRPEKVRGIGGEEGRGAAWRQVANSFILHLFFPPSETKCCQMVAGQGTGCRDSIPLWLYGCYLPLTSYFNLTQGLNPLSSSPILTWGGGNTQTSARTKVTYIPLIWGRGVQIRWIFSLSRIDKICSNFFLPVQTLKNFKKNSGTQIFYSKNCT